MAPDEKAAAIDKLKQILNMPNAEQVDRLRNFTFTLDRHSKDIRLVRKVQRF